MSERITATIYDEHRERLDEIADAEGLQSDAEAIRWCIEHAAPDNGSDATAEDVLHALAVLDRELSTDMAGLSEDLNRIEARMATADQIEKYDEEDGGWWASLTSGIGGE